MPDVNLLRDTKQPDLGTPRKRPSVDPRLTDPSTEPKRSLGDTLRSLLGRKASAPTPTEPSGSAMAVGRGSTGQRILSDKTQAAAPLVALPEDEDFNVNLLTEDIAGSFNSTGRLIQLGALAIAAMLVIGLSFFGLRYYEKSINGDVESTKDQTSAIKARIGLLEKDLDVAQQDNARIVAATTLVSNHIRWSKFFDRLERYTLPQVTYGGAFNGTLAPTITFSATTDSFERLAQQYLIFKQAIAANDFITSFSITGASKTVQEKTIRVTFSVSMNLVSSIFTSPVTSATK